VCDTACGNSPDGAALAPAYKTVGPVSQEPGQVRGTTSGNSPGGAALAPAYKTVDPVSQYPGRCAAPPAEIRRAALRLLRPTRP